MKYRAVWVLAVCLSPMVANAQGSVIVRVEDKEGSHCIDALSEDVTIHLRRIFTEKKGGLFTEDNRAGIITTAKLTGRSSGTSQDIQIPSVSLVTIKDEAPGRVSLPLEYQIASYLTLRQKDILTTDIALTVSLAKTRSRNSFGEILDIASRVLSKLPVNYPYSDKDNKFLAFANDAITATTNKQLDVPFAQVALSFNRGREPNIQKCRSEGKERTGVVAVVLDQGGNSRDRIPVTDTEQLYCFRYSSTNTYELLAARKINGTCPEEDAYHAVTNDYVMFIISGNPSLSAGVVSTEDQEKVVESRRRCRALKLEPIACGVGQ